MANYTLQFSGNDKYHIFAILTNKQIKVIPGGADQMVPLKQMTRIKLQPFANNFQTVFPREGSLLETVPLSRADIAKIEYGKVFLHRVN